MTGMRSPTGHLSRLDWRRRPIVSVLQSIEGLSDRQAAEAVRGRVDGKYALASELGDPGLNHTVPGEFRSQRVKGPRRRFSPGSRSSIAPCG
jgi:hypothetical protein